MSFRHRNFVFLVPLFVIAMAYQVTDAVLAIRQQIRGTERADSPVSVNLSRRVTRLTGNAGRAGLRVGDEVLSVNRRPLVGHQVLESAAGGSKPGQSMAVEFRRGSAEEPIVASITLEPSRTSDPDPFAWAVIVLLLSIPFFCLLLGFFVAGARPYDPQAWILLGVMLGLAHMFYFDEGRWGGLGTAQVLAMAYRRLAQGSWSIWMLLFGLYFPYRFGWERRFWWLKWVVIVPVAVNLCVHAWIGARALTSFAAVEALSRTIAPFSRVISFVSFACVSAFFCSIGFKSGTAPTPDSRRRLRLLVLGGGLGMMPTAVAVFISLLRGVQPFTGLSELIIIPIILLMFLFPLAMAYVIVVHRALDVRAVLRQGMQYALARGGVRVVLTIAATMIFLIAGSIGREAKISPWWMVVIVIPMIIVVRRTRSVALQWVDRKFFREAYQAERVLSELSESVGVIMDERPLLETVTRRISETLHVPRIAVLLNGEGPYRPAYALGYEGEPVVAFDRGSAVVDRLQAAGEPPRVYFDDPESWVHSAGKEAELLKLLDTQLLLPHSVKNKLLGFLSLGPKQSEEAYTGSDVRLLQSVAGQTGLALENSRLTSAIAKEVAQRERLNREIEIAREVQERLFPQKLPAITGVDYLGHCRPALGVGGDYYDFITLADGNFGIAIGDVSGKGIAAALLMASLQASLRSQTIEDTADLAKLMRNVNRLVFDATPSNRYATFFYAQYDRNSRRLSYVNAGHNAPMIFRRAGVETHVLRLETGGPAVGLFRDTPYQQGMLPLEPGDIFIGFTDGISEAMNAADEEWGEERLMPTVEACAAKPASEIIPTIMSAADAFANGAPQHDDMTLVVLKVESPR